MTRLKLATRNFGAFEEAFDAQIAAFEVANPDIRIKRVSAEIADHYESLEHGDIDLHLCLTDWIPEAVEGDLLLNLDPFLESDPPDDWPSGWSPSMLGLPRYRGHFHAVPWHDGPEVLHYRSDLFDDPLEMERFADAYGYPLAPPTDWDQFLDVARYFTRPERGLWGCCVGAYPDGHNNVYDFLIHLWSRGGELLGPYNEPFFDSDAGVDALTYYRDLIHRHRVADPNCLSLDSVDSGYAYASGRAAMMWNWIGFAATAELPEFSAIVGKNRCAPIPGGVSLNIFWALAILKRTENPEAAYAFVKHVCSAAMDKATSLSGANGVRLSTWRDPEILAKFPHYALLEQVHAGARTLPAIPEYPRINAHISNAVAEAMSLEKTPERALSDAALQLRCAV